jgi:methyltransferase-like protein
MDKLKLLKLEAIKKLLMLDTTIEVRNVLDVLGEAISRELDLDDKEHEEFKKWKSEKASKEIPF